MLRHVSVLLAVLTTHGRRNRKCPRLVNRETQRKFGQEFGAVRIRLLY
eukprot:COSAG02_NODE_786_length_17199_cov_25.278889_5_plen_48_part_00